MTEKKTSGAGAIVAGIAGVTAAAIGAYYLYGHKDAEKNRAKVKGWMLKAKGEVLEELEKAQEVTESAYMSAVDTVTKKYNDLKSIDAAELASFMAEMKAHWNGIKKTMENRGKNIKRSAPKKSSKNGKTNGKKSK
jgi:hypothetical protein